MANYSSATNCYKLKKTNSSITSAGARHSRAANNNFFPPAGADHPLQVQLNTSTAATALLRGQHRY